MTAINTNTGSLYAQQSMNTNSRALATVMQQLSTGKRINNAVDDVAGLAISTRLTSQIRGLNQAVRNANDGISLIQTAEGATEQVTNMLQRMRELAVQSSNDTNNSMDRGFLNGEFQQLRAEIDRIGQNTQWNGANILDGTGGNFHNGTYSFQVGANSRQTISIKLPNMQTAFDATSAGPHGDLHMEGVVTYATGVATVDFTAATVTPASDYLGAIVQVEIAGKKVQYQVSETDVANAGAATPVTIGEAIANGLATKMESMFGSDYTYDTTTAGKVVITPATGVTALGAAAGEDAVTSGSIVGDLAVMGGSDIQITDATSAYSGLQAIDSALQAVNEMRSNMGAIISRLQFASDNLSNVSAKAAESRSRIEDTDYSTATTELAKRNIIQQAAQAMLAQANQAPQLVLQLLK